MGDHTGVAARSTTTDRNPPSIPDGFDPLGAWIGGLTLKQHEALPRAAPPAWPCATSWRAASSTVSARGAPPSDETIHSPPPRVKTMPA